MKIISSTDKSAVQQTVSILRAGGLVVAPTDTVYGLLVDATNERAVEKLIQFKSRPPGKAISIFVENLHMMDKYVTISPAQRSLLEILLPGPYTIILESKHKTSKLLESEIGTLGVRVPNYDFITDLVHEFKKPLTATSANLSTKSPNYSVDSFLQSLSKQKMELLDLVIDAGNLPHNKPSTVADLTKPEVQILRQGDLEFKEENKYKSTVEDETKVIAKKLLNDLLDERQTIVIVLEGDLGVGKTVFVKGIAEQLGIHNIISPTYTVYYEYTLSDMLYKKLYHFDLYQIENEEEFKYLGLNKILKETSIICLEWGEKAASIMPLLKEKAKVVYVKMQYINEKERKIIIST